MANIANKAVKAVIDGSNSKIRTWDAIFMITLAVVIDLVQAGLILIGIGLIVNRILSLMIFGLFAFWFAMKGVNMFGNKKIVASVTGPIIEMIPLLAGLPGWTIMIIVTIGLTRAEEQGIAVPGVNKGATFNKIKKVSRRLPDTRRNKAIIEQKQANPNLVNPRRSKEERQLRSRPQLVDNIREQTI